jgi:hypothetical protein
VIVREPPQTIVQAGGKVAEGIVAGLGGTPSLLFLVILNTAMILVAGYYLLTVEQFRAQDRTALIALIQACILETQPLSEGRQP